MGGKGLVEWLGITFLSQPVENMPKRKLFGKIRDCKKHPPKSETPETEYHKIFVQVYMIITSQNVYTGSEISIILSKSTGDFS